MKNCQFLLQLGHVKGETEHNKSQLTTAASVLLQTLLEMSPQKNINFEGVIENFKHWVNRL